MWPPMRSTSPRPRREAVAVVEPLMARFSQRPATVAARVHRGELSERGLGLIMLAPMTLVLLLVIAYPLVDALWLSLHRVNLAHPGQGQPFIGLSNYLYAFGQMAFWSSLGRSLYFTGVSVGLEFALGLLFAVMLNERFRGNLGARL